MAHILIVDTPPTFTDFNRRMFSHLVGIVLPVATEDDLKSTPPPVFSPISVRVDDYLVMKKNAIQALLDAGRLDAASHWSQLNIGPYFRFSRSIAVEVFMPSSELRQTADC